MPLLSVVARLLLALASTSALNLFGPAFVQPGPNAVAVAFSTTAGDFTARLDRDLSPLGVERFLGLVDEGFFEGMLLYRVVPGFLVQFGVAADPAVQARWEMASLADEENGAAFRRGTISFAGGGEDSRSCHLFVALEPHGKTLGQRPHEATLGWVDEEGMDVFDRVVANFESAGYPDTGGLQGGLVREGNAAASDYPALDRIIACHILG